MVTDLPVPNLKEVFSPKTNEYIQMNLRLSKCKMILKEKTNFFIEMKEIKEIKC